MKLRIVHKGLLLLVLPLICQWLFFAELYRLMERASQLQKQEQTETRFQELLNSTVLEFAAGTSAIYELTGSSLRRASVDPSNYEMRTDKVLNECDAIAVTLKDDEAQQLVANLRQVLTAQVAAMRTISGKGDSEIDAALSPILRALKLRPFVKDIAKHLIAVRTTLDTRLTKLHRKRAEEEAARKRIQTQISIGLLTDTILVIALLLFFLRDITARLSGLVRNAHSIPSGEGPKETVGGDDELAYLDGVLHSVYDQLQRAAEHRKSVMEMVAHDLRSPLASAGLALELLEQRDGEETDEERRLRIRRLQQELNRMLVLVEDLLTIEKLEAGKLELSYDYVKLDDVVGAVVESTAMLAAQKNLKVTNEVEPIELEGDPSRITQLVNNLLSNAFKYSPPGGAIRIFSVQEQGVVKVSVADEGVGIPEEKQADLFLKYYQANKDDSRKGFGLGLAICKLIVEQHQGTISVESKPGSGSTFTFTLPRVSIDDE